MFYIFWCFNLRAGGDDSAFSNTSIILQLREQVSQLQVILQEKEEIEKTAAQKLAMYQNQLHAKNNEVAILKDQLQAQVRLNVNENESCDLYKECDCVIWLVPWNLLSKDCTKENLLSGRHFTLVQLLGK